ncbi:retinitis pigmentosa 1-like 1 protein [Tiliqua scincoides]|uniref:retinitis pigmentosa 1-like 1 protein n=1 Tax=Tiliqua scincoides TaxID=71010 RepID=UPI0034628858
MTQLPPDYLSTTSTYNYDQPLPPVARTIAVTQVPPAKKITFYKSGDPQFGGVKMAINQRSFKSFNALMDDLSHRVPLPFGVRTITTPQGIHCISALDQLEDGGCYLCSDKKYVTPISIGTTGRRAGPPRNSQPASELKRAAQEVKHEDYSTAFTQQRLRIPKKITLVKNGDITIRRPIILNRRNARSFKTLLDEISEIMQFTVKKLYTVDGKKIDSMQALLHCPNVLMCVGRELFKPIVTEHSRKPSVEKLPGLTSRSNSHVAGENNGMNFGLKAKKSVIHPRSSLSNRSMRISLSSEKSYPNGLTTSSENGASCSNNCPHSKGGELVHSLVNDDIEKRVHVNKDGSLSVEMKVRFRLLNDETLQWSTQIKKSSLMNTLPCEESGIDEDNGVDLTEKSNPEASSEMDDSLYPCDADSYISKLDESENEEACCHNCGKLCKDYDIWKNPMHTSQKEEPGIRNTWYAHSSCSSTSSHRRIVHKKMTSVDSIHTSSSGEYSEHVVRESSCYTETVENRVGYHTGSKCCCRCNCTKTNTSQRGSPEEPELVACSVNSQNEEDGPGEAIVVQEGDESHGSRARSRKSKSSQGSVESQVKMCEETSNVMRCASSCSVKKAEVEDTVGCPSSPNSVCSRPSKCSTPLTKDTRDEVSENDQVILSFSNESCPKKDIGEGEGEVEKEEEEINEIHSVSENIASSQSVKDEASECGRCSTERPDHCKTCNGSSRRSDSDEIHMCSAASSSSRVSKRSKHSQNHLETGSKMSAGSPRTSSTRKKKTNSSLHAEDRRSNSKASYYSRSSQEAEKRVVEGQASHDSSSPHSNVSSPANNEEGTGSTSKCYSKSSKSSQKESQQEDISKTSSPCSSFPDSIEKNGNGDAQVRSETPSASMAESTCSKCGHMRKTQNDDLQSVHSRVSSHSKCAETEASGRSGDAGSQSSMAQSSKPRPKKKNSLHADGEHSSRASASGSASMYSLHRPAPPKGRPSNRKGRTVMLKKNSNTTSMYTESESMADKERKEKANSQAPEMDMAEEEEGSCHQKSQGEPSGEGDALGGSEEVIPSSLPNTTPEEVVHEWLRKIPSKTLPMQDEMQDDGEGSALDIEIPSCSESQEPLEEELGEKKEDTEECKSTAADETAVEEAEEEALDRNKDPSDEKASEAMSEAAKGGTAECNQSVISSQNNHQKDLPSTIQTSVQIMKALLASKQEAKLDRSHSLPEVSPTMGRKLSNSANILITCLASLQLLDEELGPSSKSECLNRPRYTELLNIFQALWSGCASEKSGPSSDQHGEVQEKVAAGFKGHNSKEGDFTPMSSSGVDVSSGDGGSGEGSVGGTPDCGLPLEKTDKAKQAEEEANMGDDEEEEEQEEDSQLPTPCSKSEGGEKPESAGGEVMAEAQENLDSDCEIGQEEEKEMTEEQEVEETNGEEEEGNAECEENNAEADVVQGEAQEETVVAEAEDSPRPEDADEATTEPGNNEADSNASEANDEGELESNAEKQPVVADPEPQNQATVKASPAVIQQRSIDPDPVWVLKLLKKIEKEFMTHYVSAMNDFKVKWNLPNSKELDLMIAELKEEVSRRIEKSIEVELRKIRSRAGKRTPRPPDDGLQRESTLQAQHRRRRFQSLHRMSLFNDRNRTQSKRPETRESSRESDDAGFLFRTTIRDGPNEQPSEEEYCPCDACIQKKMDARATVNTVVVVSNAPVVKAFDLQQILRMKKGDVVETKAEDGSAEGAEGKEAASGKQAEATSEPEENQETEPTVEGAPDAASEPEGKEAPADGEEAPENQNCEEVEGEEAGKEEVEEDLKVGVEEEGSKEEEETVKEEDENTENEEKEEEEKETVQEEEGSKEEEAKEEEVEEEEAAEEEEKEAKEEEETAKEEDDNKEEEVEEAKEEEMEEAEEKEDETVNEEDKEEEAKEEEVEEEEEEAAKEEEEEAEEEAKEEVGEAEEEAKKEEVEAEEEEEEETIKEEDDNKEEEEAVEEEAEEEAKEEEETVKEEEDVEEDEETKEEEVEEPDAKEEEETVKEEAEEEGKEEADEKENEEIKEEEAEEKETENDEDVEEEEEKAEEEMDLDANPEEKAKSEGEGEMNEAREKDMHEEHEATPSEEVEEDPIMENETEGVEVSEAEPEGGDNAAGEEAEGDASAEAECCLEAADMEDDAEMEESGDAEDNREEAEGPVQDDREEEGKEAEEDGTNEGAQSPRNGSALSHVSSVGNCSLQSQKGSLDASDREDDKEENVDNDNDDGSGEVKTHTESNSPKMYPDSDEEEEEEEEDGASSQTSAVQGGEPQTDENEDGQAPKKKKKDSEVIDQDDLDF